MFHLHLLPIPIAPNGPNNPLSTEMIHALDYHMLVDCLYRLCLPRSTISSRKTNYGLRFLFSLLLSQQVSSVTQSCPTLCDPMDCSTLGFPIHHQLPQLTHSYVHQVSDTMQPSHPLSSPYPSAFNLSQHQSQFQ